jgi:predicted nucleic acid-binding Zn ribbon protein
MSFRRLGEIMPQTLEGMGLLQRLQAMRVLRSRPRAVGRAAPELAGGAQAVELRDGVLAVRVPDGLPARQLERAAAEIVRALNAEVGERAVERVVRVR